MSNEPRIVDKDHGWRDLFKLVREIKNAKIKVGVLADSEEGGLHAPGEKLTVTEIAVVNEFGTEDGIIPERSFVRSTFDEQREKLTAMGADLIKRVLDRKLTLETALGIMGLWMATAIKNKIVSHVPPPNAPSTIAKKGSDTPLVDTSRMLNSVTWAVAKEGEEE